MPFYIKKPVEYEIIKWSGKNVSEMNDFVSPDIRTSVLEKQSFKIFLKNQRPMIVYVGDYIGYEKNFGYFLLKENEFKEQYVEAL